MQKRLVILGSTGSIGESALQVADALRGQFQVVGLTANSRWQRLAEQAERFSVPYVAIADETHRDTLRATVSAKCHVLSGNESLSELINVAEPDFVLSAIVGAAGLPATLTAVQNGISVGLANKESLVIAGSLLMPLARRRGAQLIPVDSEHSAIFQALRGENRASVRKIYLTASGGPFRTWTAEQIEGATLAEALNHPTWSMGPKITIDSATMMNKALEIIEARHLFGFDTDEIEVLIHPESIVHSMVEFCDGPIIAQLGTADMKTPIQYAMTYPQRAERMAESLDWTQARTLNFEPPNFDLFPALKLGFEAARRGGTAGAALNAANEAAVQRFRDGTLSLGQVVRVSEDALRRHTFIETPTLDQLLAVDAWARQEVEACIRC
ncbi:MAG: 1-deoxy-D-xylulose-5-phosphate reductoisomerase [Planctomycetes bacterium]|nr:1-deoxy-D-xylulose-5-phosphate reductoisomerase [Planctomycetota bacterium]